MKALYISCLLIFFLLNIKTFRSFSQHPVFTPVPAPGGSWGIRIIFCTQDPKGYMWFGAIGLHRYDGYRYKSYYNTAGDTTSLALNRIQCIWADRKGIIWVGTNGGGLDRLDPETDIFTHFRNDSTDPTSISHNKISAIMEDQEGKIWVGTAWARSRSLVRSLSFSMTRYFWMRCMTKTSLKLPVKSSVSAI